MPGSACPWCAELLVQVAGRCRACGEATPGEPAGIPPRWDGDRLITPGGVAWPAGRCLRCAAFDVTLSGPRGMPLCVPCAGSERRLGRAIAVIWTVALALAVGPLGVVVDLELHEALPFAVLLGVLSLLLALIVVRVCERRRIRVVSRGGDELWLAVPDPAATRRALASEPEPRG